MKTSEQDTEITLGTGRMLALFFALVLVCAVFFAIGFSLGRKTTMLSLAGPLSATPGSPSALRPSASASKDQPKDAAAKPEDFSFYKTVGEKNADTTLAPQTAQAAAPQTGAPQAATNQPPPEVPASTTASSAANGYFVQVAAVSRQEDAEALVEALKKKQYPAFSATNASADKFFHVQVGPYGDLKNAEAMRARLITDGYSPILKR